MSKPLPSAEELVRWFSLHYMNESSAYLSDVMMDRVRLFRNEVLEAAVQHLLNTDYDNAAAELRAWIKESQP